MQPLPTDPTLHLVRGELRIAAWPAAVQPPYGLRAEAGLLLGPPRLRRAALDALAAAGVACVDTIAVPRLDDDERPVAPSPRPIVAALWHAHGGRGVCGGLAEATRVDVVTSVAHDERARGLLVVRDAGAVATWQRTLQERGLPAAPDDGRPTPCAVVAVAAAAATMHWRARRHDLLVVDRPEQMPGPDLAHVLDGSAARLRLGFVDRAGLPRVMAWSAGLGPLLVVADHEHAVHRVALHVPLTADERLAYDAAFHTFLCAYDAFVAARPGTGFHDFVQQARRDPAQRPAVFAWHRACGVAAWTTAKATAVAELLRRHRGDRVLVFTPDRGSTYAIAREHLIAAVTAELPAGERRATLAAFAGGRLRALAGPRLLDLGVPAGSADVGIVVGGGFGRAQHEARLARIAAGGVVYLLTSQDTVEIGRAQRITRAAAAASHPLHDDGR